jgi:hypothetical protein
VELALRNVRSRANVLYLAYDRLDLIGRGGLFHDDHHLDLILCSFDWRFLTAAGNASGPHGRGV